MPLKPDDRYRELFDLISRKGDESYEAIRETFASLSPIKREQALRWVREFSNYSKANSSLLHLAAEKNAIKVTRLLVEEYRADINFGRDATLLKNRTPLHYAAFKNSSRVAQYLLTCRNPLPLIVHKDLDGRTPLHMAARYGAVGVINVLLDKHPDIVDLHDKHASPPLCLAIHYRQREAFDTLLDRGAAIPEDVLIHAIKHDPEGGFVRNLIDRGANVTFARKLDGMTPLHRAANKFHLQATRWLLECPGVHVDVIDRFESTPLHYAVLDIKDESKRDLSFCLIEHGANLQAKSKKGKAPLDDVSDDNHKKMLIGASYRNFLRFAHAVIESSYLRHVAIKKMLGVEELRKLICLFMN